MKKIVDIEVIELETEEFGIPESNVKLLKELSLNEFINDKKLYLAKNSEWTSGGDVHLFKYKEDFFTYGINDKKIHYYVNQNGELSYGYTLLCLFDINPHFGMDSLTKEELKELLEKEFEESDFFSEEELSSIYQ